MFQRIHGTAESVAEQARFRGDCGDSAVVPSKDVKRGPTGSGRTHDAYWAVSAGPGRKGFRDASACLVTLAECVTETQRRHRETKMIAPSSGVGTANYTCQSAR